jgi:hypothetical protein
LLTPTSQVSFAMSPSHAHPTRYQRLCSKPALQRTQLTADRPAGGAVVYETQAMQIAGENATGFEGRLSIMDADKLHPCRSC